MVITAPYMHDGRFTDLNAVLDHYNNGVKQLVTLAAQLQSGAKPELPFWFPKRPILIAFLSTLTD
ncbi:MAG: hypothetical protein IPO65_16735 [Saprospiraceae bacterium]|nr:hypothetical protein [Saprospiraceae bacterium]